MKTFSKNLLLLRLYIQSMSWNLWAMIGLNVLLIVLNTATHIHFSKRMDGFSFESAISSSAGFSIYFPLFMLAIFLSFARGSQSNGVNTFPCQEFLLNKPISRRRSYFTLMMLFFAAMAFLIVVRVVAVWHESSLRYEYYDSSYQNTGQYDLAQRERIKNSASKMEMLSKIFSNTKLLESEGRKKLIIPFAYLYLMLFFGTIIFTFSMGMQLMDLFLYSLKGTKIYAIPIMLVAFIPIVFSMMRMYSTLKSDVAVNWSPGESAFLFFVQHWMGIALLMVVAFVAIQALAWWRVPKLEEA